MDRMSYCISIHKNSELFIKHATFILMEYCKHINLCGVLIFAVDRKARKLPPAK